MKEFKPLHISSTSTKLSNFLPNRQNPARRFRSNVFFRPRESSVSNRPIGERINKTWKFDSFPQENYGVERETVERMIRSSVNYRLPESLLRKPRVNLRVSSGQKAYLIYFKPRKLIRPRNTSTTFVPIFFFVFFFFTIYNNDYISCD